LNLAHKEEFRDPDLSGQQVADPMDTTRVGCVDLKSAGGVDLEENVELLEANDWYSNA